jgi:hypothetical protein
MNSATTGSRDGATRACPAREIRPPRYSCTFFRAVREMGELEWNEHFVNDHRRAQTRAQPRNSMSPPRSCRAPALRVVDDSDRPMQRLLVIEPALPLPRFHGLAHRTPCDTGPDTDRHDVIIPASVASRTALTMIPRVIEARWNLYRRSLADARTLMFVPPTSMTRIFTDALVHCALVAHECSASIGTLN